MTDLTTPDTALPQPPREPLSVEVVEPSPEQPEDAQEPAEGLIRFGMPDAPRKIGKTIAGQMDERVRVMQARNESFKAQLSELGVVDPNISRPGLRGKYITALRVADELEAKLRELRSITSDVNETFDTL